MLYRKSVIRAAFAMVAGLGIATSSWGQSLPSATIGVTGTVSQVCGITATPIAFLGYDPIGTNASANLIVTGTVSVKCTSGSSGITIGLNAGLNGSHGVGTTRAMVDSGGSNYLGYEIYQPNGTNAGDPCASATVWTISGAVGSFTPTTTWGTTARTFNVCGVVPKGQNAVVGTTYADTVTANVYF